MMKRIINLCFIGLFLITITACEDDEEIEVNFSDMEVYVPNWAGTDDQLIGAKININDWLVFMDLSQGAVSHEWSTGDSTGIKFLQQNLPPIETNENYLEYIDEELGTTSEEFIAPVIYTNPGLQGLRLYNTFRDSVGFSLLGNVKSAEFDPDLNLWVIDTTFFVDVYDSITPAFTVKDFAGFEIPLRLVDTAEITLRVGDVLTFVDESTIGRPNDRIWTIPGATVADARAETVQATYTQVSAEGQFFIPWILSRRFGESVPGNSRSAVIPLKVRVIPPEANVEFLNLTVNDDGNIVIEFNQGIVIPNMSDLTIQYDGVTQNITSINHFSEQNRAALVLEMEKIPQFGTEVTLSVAALTITSEFSTAENPKLNDNAISGSTTSSFGVIFREDFEAGLRLSPDLGNTPTEDEWARQSGVTFTLDADGFEGSAASFTGTSDLNVSVEYVWSPFFDLEVGKKYVVQCQIKATDGDQVGKQARIFMFQDGGLAPVSARASNHTLTTDYATWSTDLDGPSADGNSENFYLRLGNAAFAAGDPSRPIKFLIDNIIIFEKIE